MQLTIATPPSTNFIMGGWQQAGNVLRVEGEGPWMVEMSEMWKGTPSEELVMKDLCKENGDEWPHGDRRQELVFIGHNMKHEAIQKALDQCLLTDEEMELGREKWEETMAEVDKIQLSLEEEEEDDEDEDSEDISEEKVIEELTLKFESMSQTVRRELEHLDFILKEEFEQAFSSYNTYYFNSINKSREATSTSLALRDAVVDQAFSAYNSKKHSADMTGHNQDFRFTPNGEAESIRKITTISNVGHINVIDE